MSKSRLNSKSDKSHIVKVENQVNLLKGLVKKLQVEVDVLGGVCESSVSVLRKFISNFCNELEQIPKREKNFLLANNKVDKS